MVISKNRLQFKEAFTMLELIMVIVILGIVASISSSMIANVYESYIVQRALHNTSTKAEIVAQQIANRLANRIPLSTIRKKQLDGTWWFIDINVSSSETKEYGILEWIGYDADSFNAQGIPGWSGFCDTDPSTRTDIITPGSQLSTTDTIIRNLSKVGGVATANITNAAIIFSGPDYSDTPLPIIPYKAECMGFTLGDTSCISPVSGTGSDFNLTLFDNNAKTIRDQYKLAWSAYAIVPSDPDGDGIFDLHLYYNYQPWLGETYAAGSVSTLVTDVTVFRFKGQQNNGGREVSFKVCTLERIGDQNITSCQEKVDTQWIKDKS